MEDLGIPKEASVKIWRMARYFRNILCLSIVETEDLFHSGILGYMEQPMMLAVKRRMIDQIRLMTPGVKAHRIIRGENKGGVNIPTRLYSMDAVFDMKAQTLNFDLQIQLHRLWGVLRNEERYIVTKLYEGYSLAAIGKMMTPTLTESRVCQIRNEIRHIFYTGVRKKLVTRCQTDEELRNV